MADFVCSNCGNAFDGNPTVIDGKNYCVICGLSELNKKKT